MYYQIVSSNYFLHESLGGLFLASSIGRVAQRIRRLTTNQKIVGSNPIVIIFNKVFVLLLRVTLKNSPLRVGFEPTREDPIWFLVKRLNHSAIAACLLRSSLRSKRTIVNIRISSLKARVDRQHTWIHCRDKETRSNIRHSLFRDHKFGLLVHETIIFPFLHRPRGPMDKASDFESEDCGFDPHRGQFSGKT